ncbi:MAG: Flp pilus assembly protein CpaB [Dehalococcoidia bacterium]
MARPMTSVAVGRVNRRFLFLALILATLSGILAYAALSQGGGDSGTTSSVDISVVVAKDTILAGDTISEDMIEEKVLSQDAVGAGHLSSLDAAVGLQARYPIEIGEPLLQSNFVGTGEISNDALSHILKDGQRGMAIDVDMVIGAGGLVLPGDHVDILWIPNGAPEDTVGGQLLAENVEVVAVAQILVELPATISAATPEAPAGGEEDDRTRGSLAPPNPQAATVTFMVTPQQGQNIFCGDIAGEIRLAVRQLGDVSPTGLVPVQCIVQGTEG